MLCVKTQQNDRSFFRTMVAYFLGKVAATMRATVVTKDRGKIPVNVYAMALANSGFSKGKSVYLVENDLLGGFKERFIEDTFHVIADQNLWSIAGVRSARNGSDLQDEYDKALKEFRTLGSFIFSFDSGTPEGVKQMRQKLLMGLSGSISMQIDEIGSNIEKQNDLLTLFLELYDMGTVKQKLVKNSSDNQRSEERDGKTPANLLMFGVPSRLFDGASAETSFYTLLETGYARRCLFGYGVKDRAGKTKTAEEIYKMLSDQKNNQITDKWAHRFQDLADPTMFNWSMELPDDVAITLIKYQLECENEADELPEHEEIRKSELAHRYFKALKIAGSYAFVDGSTHVMMDHLLSAIKLVEESGKAFSMILSRDAPYVKLAKYIASVNNELTHADIKEKLPFYPAPKGAREDMLLYAISWGYKNNIIIKRSMRDGIDFLVGETLEKTDIDKITFSYSDHWAYEYRSEVQPFDQLHVLTQAPGMNWCNHHFKNSHRAKENAIVGFNLIVIDIDGGIRLEAVHELLKDFKFLTYTTKSHSEEHHRFRLIMPTNFRLKLDEPEYKEFMDNIMDWLPFPKGSSENNNMGMDPTANQQSKKWSSFEGGTYHYNIDGDLFNVLDFIPKTRRNEEFRGRNQELGSLDNLERWFAQRMGGEGSGRNNQMIKYALCLVDSGMALPDVVANIKAFNQKISHPLEDSELEGSILVTVAKKIQERTPMAA